MAQAVQHDLPASPEQNSSHPDKWSRFSVPGSSCTRFCSWFPLPPVQEEPRTLRTSSEEVGGVPLAADFAQGELGYRFPQFHSVEGNGSWPNRSFSESGAWSIIGFSLPSSQSEE